MQITLNQSQIEEAITDWLNARMKTEEGYCFSIDLRATRGDDGYTAVIDVVREGEDTTRPTPAPAPATRTVAPKAAPKKLDIAKKIEAAREEAPATEDVQDDEPPFETDDVETGEEATKESTDAEESEQEDAAPAEAPKSIFANLKKPVNA